MFHVGCWLFVNGYWFIPRNFFVCFSLTIRPLYSFPALREIRSVICRILRSMKAQAFGCLPLPL
jgi:hypothetical protein